MADQRHLFRVRRERQVSKLAERGMGCHGTSRGADQLDGNFERLVGFCVELPNLEVVFEDHGLSVVADGRP